MLAIKTYCQPQTYYQPSGKKTICIFSKDAWVADDFVYFSSLSIFQTF